MEPLRRKDRRMPEEEAWELLRECGWAMVAMTGEDGLPYCVPVSPALEGDRLYFHCAKRGEKVKALSVHPEVCVTAVGDWQTIQAEFTVHYRSVVARGRAALVTNEAERLRALELISRKYCPDDMETGFAAELEREGAAAAVYAIRISHICGKKNPNSRN